MIFFPGSFCAPFPHVFALCHLFVFGTALLSNAAFNSPGECDVILQACVAGIRGRGKSEDNAGSGDVERSCQHAYNLSAWMHSRHVTGGGGAPANSSNRRPATTAKF
jgi:hypothetical protein